MSIVAIVWCGPAALARQSQAEVLVLYSTRRDAQLSIVGDRELPRILEQGLPGDVDFYSEYLDLARSNDADYLRQMRHFLEVKYRGIEFDVVVAVQDAAIGFVERYRREVFPRTPVVFVASQATPPRLAEDAATGILAPPDLAGTLDLAAALQPDANEVFVVTGAGAIDRSYERLAREQLRRFEPRFRITYLSGLPMADLRARLASLPPRSFIYFVMLYRDGANADFNPLQALETLTRVANAPVYCWVDAAIDRGIVGGHVKDQRLQTEVVGNLVLRVLKGERAERIPVDTPVLHRHQVDWRQLQRWNISEARVPAGTTVRFRTPSAWERYRPYILAALALLLAQTVLIAGLLWQRMRRRRAEADARATHVALQGSYRRIRDLAARLLHAQDQERARIARDLHDDISQQMALVEIDLDLLRGGVDDAQEVVAEALERVRGVSRSVHELSHRLHPAKLQLMGLVAALDGLRRELSHPGMVITVTRDEVLPPLPADITLCLFRVGQEALQNAVKYSRAAGVTVHLGSTADTVTLDISDDGTGFDADAVGGRGLGLISMRERVDSVGGQFAVWSAPGAGTRITVSVPCRQPQPASLAG